MLSKYYIDENRPFFKGRFWPNGVPHQLEYDFSTTLPQMLEETVNKYPNDPVYWFMDTFLTYREFKNFVDRFASGLAKRGVKKGDVIAILLPNSFQYVISYYAITTLGAIATGINPTYKPQEILHQIKLTGANIIITLDFLYQESLLEIIDEFEFKEIIFTNILDLANGMPKWKKFLGKLLKKIPSAKIQHPKATSFLKILQTPIDLPHVEINAETDTASLIMTGGTTGVPKAAELTHLNCVSNAQQAKLFLTRQINPDENYILGNKTGVIGVLPLFHSYAHTVIMNSVVCVGAWAALFPKPPPSEELLRTITNLPNYNFFIYPGVEILFQRIAELPQKIIDKYPFHQYLKLCTSAAGPLHDYVRKPFETKTQAKLTELYGLTEASPGVSANNFYGLRESGTLGVPLPGTDWKIFPQDNFEKGPIPDRGEQGTGEICITGPQVMKGYWQNPEQTAEDIKEYEGKRWLLTGDIGFMDDDGRVTIRDRKKQLIKVAGHSVFPKEVETLIGNHPDVLEVAVAGLPDYKTGEAVKAWVSLKPQAIGKLDPQTLMAWCRENITSWKVPKYLEFIDQVPKNVIGKVMRRELQEKDPLFTTSFNAEP